MPPPDRFDIIVPLHEVAGWRRALAVDKGGVAPRAVVLSYPPSALTDDPTRLVGLMRDAEAAALVHHPNALPALGLETSGDLLVAVEAYRRGVSLRTLLDVARKLPPELAARVAVDACAALAAVHAVDPGDGHLLVHGGVSPARLLVADDGSTLLCGTGTAGGGAPADDVRGVAAVLHECLLGEPPASAPAPIDDPFLPPALAEVVSRALGASPGGPYDAPEALSDAIAGAVPPAPPEALAAYLEAILPAGEGERGELLRLVAHGLSRAANRGQGASEPARPVDVSSPAVAAAAEANPETLARAASPAAAAPWQERAPEPSRQTPAASALAPPPAQVQPAGVPGAAAEGVPATAPGAASAPQPVAAPLPPSAAADGPRRDRSRLVVAVAVAMAVLGFGGGYLVSRSRAPASAPAVVAATPAPAPGAQPAPPAAAPPTAAPPTAAAPTAAAPTAAAPAAAAPAAAAPAPGPTPAPAPAPVAGGDPTPRAAAEASIAVSSEPPGEVYVDGKRVGRSPLTVPVPRGDHEVRLRSRYEGVDVRRSVTVRGPGTPVRFALRRGALKVTAPEDAEVFVDGRHVGKGDVKVELWEGDHLVEARLGAARVQERFKVGPGETWTYDVTPTK